MTASALLIAGLVTAGSATNTTVHTEAPQAAPEALLAAAASDTGSGNAVQNASDQTVGLVPAAPEAPRKLSAMTPPADGRLGGNVQLQNIALPGGTGALGIPELVLAAYRNAELALESSTPGCGLPWNLLAGIGRIESLHASGGRTDAAGTTISPIYGPALDGTLPGNEVIKATNGGYVRAVGPMQFLPSTWVNYASDGNGDGVSDPNNVFDAALAAGKYLCSGGLDLRDPAQQLRAVLRYNNSMSYAANVLSWSNAYKTGGTPSAVNISADMIPPGALTAGPDMTAASVNIPATTTTTTTTDAPPSTTRQTPTQVMINIPGLPPIPCGIFCPAPVVPANPCESVNLPPTETKPDAKPEDGVQVGAQDKTDQDKTAGEQQFGPDGKPIEKTTTCAQPQQQDPAAQAQQQPNNQPAQPAKTDEPAPPAPEPAPAPESVDPTTPAPGITLPFGITIPLPAPPAPAVP
ncbi:lytic murein transglycosylase [Nocardia sp. NPDC052001]|uniref:lytic transglycosylase domain-containing protein n=1 Tax=Nocardia sp. NPDC052001 TaxID=3154853 RepID=UPI003432AB07